VICIHRLSGWAGRNRGRALPAEAEGPSLGGSVWAGLHHVVRSPYLLGICFYLFCYTTLSTLLYLEMARLVSIEFTSSRERTQLFAALDLTVNLLTLAIQVFVTGRVLPRIGVTATLALLPALAVLGFIALGMVPVLAVLAVLAAFGVVRRAGEFALAKPAREVLFTVVAREEKYKAKNVIDTAVYRGGDMLSSWLVAALRGLGLGLPALSFARCRSRWRGSRHRYGWDGATRQRRAGA
jgi:AAA family ATP:ADP antiporter